MSHRASLPTTLLSGGRLRASALLLTLTALGTPGAARAQDFETFITKLEVNQAIQTGATSLVAGRATFVRTLLRVLNPPTSPLPLDGVMHVFVDGAEAPFSPVFSDNGPFPALAAPNLAVEDGTLNFVFLAPESANVVITVDVNPPGPNHVAEVNTANNSHTTGVLSFTHQKVPEIAYSPIDYRPGGGSTPNPPDAALIEPGMGDNFVQGIYPSSDWYYHRTDAPDKLWTSSLNSSGVGLLNSLLVDIALMVPVPDFLYGWVPGGLPYNGVSYLNNKVAMGNTQSFKYQRTFAHELGHNFGLSHNSSVTNLYGIDVENHLNLTEGLPVVKDVSLKDIMFPGLNTNQAWIKSANYEFFFNHSVFNEGASAPVDESGGPGLLIAGEWNTASGQARLTHVLELPGAPGSSQAVPAGVSDLTLRAFAGTQLVRQIGLRASTGADEGVSADDAAQPSSPLVGFQATIPSHAPDGQPVDRVEIAQAGARPFGTLSITRSAAAPQVAFLTPDGTPLDGSRVLVSWNGGDPDGDALSYYLRYSPDGKRFVPLATGVTQSSLEVDLSGLPAPVPGAALFELRASDGLNTSRVVSEPLRFAGSSAFATGANNPPWVEVVTPDAGKSYPFGATVILHSSGWDLEDRALSGTSLQWTSDLDGPLGSGRLTSVSSLSVGTHVITVTATDSGGGQTSDSAAITITPRGLPDAGGEVCQLDLGFGGPGSSVLSMCGGDLSSGTSADVQLSGAPASTTAFLVFGAVNAPTPTKGGVLVPVPWSVLDALTTDANGDLLIAAVPGGGGPLSTYLQFVLVDGAQPQGFGFSNALQVDFGP